MKILYAVQGTGNGHVARARHLIPHLQQFAAVEVWISGTESQLDLPGGPHQMFSGISLKYNRHGGLSLWRTLRENRWIQFLRDVVQAPVQNFDLIVNDFEPVSAWAVRLRGGNLIELSHQAGVRHPKAPRPKRPNRLGAWVLHNYAPSRQSIGFHVQAIEPHVHPPLIRREIRQLPMVERQQLLVYLPAYHLNALAAAFSACTVPVRAFVPSLTDSFTTGSLMAEPVDSRRFLEAFAESDSVLCSAGFELPTEALFHGKRIAVIPIKGQYEQACNATALRKAGAWQASSLKKLKLEKWLHSPRPQPQRWPDFSEELVREVLGYARQQLSAST